MKVPMIAGHVPRFSPDAIGNNQPISKPSRNYEEKS